VAGLLLIRYGELALKSPPVRREFEQRLRRNLLDQFLTANEPCRLTADHGHFYVECREGAPGARLAARVFGVTSVSVVREVPTERTAIETAVLDLAEPALPASASFAVRARRTGSHPFTSQELARDLGAAVLARWPDRSLRVDLDHPDVELFVEVRGPKTYLYTDRRAGPGGLPLGVAGQVVSLVDGPRGAVGAFLMMKRGCRSALVCTPGAERFARDVLARFDPGVRIEPAAAEAVDARLETLAEELHAEAIVLPLSVDEYAGARERWADRVVFSPTVGLDETEVAERWDRIVALAG